MEGKIYLIKAGESNFYKIGKTTRDVQSRLKEHQTSNYHTLHIVKVLKVKNLHKVESILKREFQRQKEKGEWFSNIDPQTFEKSVTQIDNNVTYLKNNSTLTNLF